MYSKKIFSVLVALLALMVLVGCVGKGGSSRDFTSSDPIGESTSTRDARVSSSAENFDIAPVKTCDFSDIVLSDDFYVYAAGGYSGLNQNIQIDQSGHQATEFTLFINVADKPVVLILSAYEPSIWQIKFTQETKISAAYLSGYHKQIITGLPEETNLLNATDVSYCNSRFIVSQDRLSALNPLSKSLFGKSVDMVYFAKQGLITIGSKIDIDEYISFKAKPTSFFHDKTKPLAGPMGIQDAVNKKILRRATKDDYKPIYEYLRKDNPSVHDDSPTYYVPHNAYVIEKEFTLPAGLYGAHSVNLILKEGVPFPSGELGHSCLFDLNTYKTHGATCHF
ncbi:MAG: hypothetical protein LBF13_01630 [Campylobacteraceae bacterium]|jgi:hypothetical protein|nr:hypothetical protein [Campylobacteraceae bacterium]